jgi:hypothetical protein
LSSAYSTVLSILFLHILNPVVVVDFYSCISWFMYTLNSVGHSPQPYFTPSLTFKILESLWFGSLKHTFVFLYQIGVATHKNISPISVPPWCKPNVGQPCSLLNSKSHTERTWEHQCPDTSHTKLQCCQLSKVCLIPLTARKKYLETLWRSLKIN